MKPYPLGLNITPEEKMQNIVAIAHAEQLLSSILFKYPDKFDWRDVGGKNFITPVDDQQGCGACVAFATCAVGEAMKRIETKDETLKIDLSKWFLFKKAGGSCETGSNFERMLSSFKNPGTVDEPCCPYLGDSICPDWAQRLTKAASYTTLKTAAQAKDWISTYGPVMGGMEVCYDFFNVDSDKIYTPESGDFVGNHAITIIGYDEINRCWIVKNSWGKEWGASGFCRIAYNECGIGSSFYFYGVDMGQTPPGPGPDPNPIKPGTDDLNITKTGKLNIKLGSLRVNYPVTVELYRPVVKELGTFSRGETGKVLLGGKVNKGDIVGFKITTHEDAPRTFFTDGLLNPGKYRNLFTMRWGSNKWHILGELTGRPDHAEMNLEVSVT